MGEIFERVLPPAPLDWTGERLTTATAGQVEIEHLHRYFLARTLARGLDVLDVASGEGYGSALLAQAARSVVGVEISAQAVAHAAAAYRLPNLRFVEGNACALPLADAAVDIVVSFETIEHFYDHDAFLAEVRRVLRPNGRFVVSSPERDVYSPPGSPANPFHVHELSRGEFERLLGRSFAHVRVLAQRPMVGSVLVSDGGAGGTLTFERRGPHHFEASDGLPRAVYVVAIASDGPVDDVPDSLYLDASETGAGADHAAAEAEAGQRALRWSEALLHGKDHLLQAKEDFIRFQDDNLQARDAALRHRDALIDMRDAVIQMKDKAIRQLEEQMKLHGAEIDRQEEARRTLENDVQRVLANRFALEQEHAQRLLQARLDRLRLEMSYVTSTSWRLTAPFRAAVRALRHLPPAALPAPEIALPTPAAPEFVPPMPPGGRVDDAAAAPVAAPVEPTDADRSLDARGAMRQVFAARLRAFLAGTCRLRLPASVQPDVSIILILYNQAELTLGCLSSIIEAAASSDLGLQIVILDNNSSDDTGALLDRLEGADIIRSPYNMHFLKGVNAAVGTAAGRHILLLNNDAQLVPGALDAAVRILDSDPQIGAVGGRIILPDGTLQEAGSIVWNDGACSGYGRGRDPNDPEFMFQRDVDYCSGAFLMTPRGMFETLGGFDERYAPAYYEETDYCLRLWEAGFRVVCDPDVVILHYEFGSSASAAEAIEQQQRNRVLFCQSHGLWLRDQLPPSPANELAARTARSRARRILVFEDRIPHVALGAGYPRANRIVHELVAAGAEVTFFPAFRHKESWSEARRALGRRVEIMLYAEGSQLRRFLESRRSHYDAILVCRPHNMQAFQDMIGADRSLIADVQILYDAEAVFARRSLLQQQTAGVSPDPAAAQKIVAEEIGLARTADAVTSVSAAEKQLFEAHGVKNVRLLSYALDETPISMNFDERPDIVFLGAVADDNSPNVDSIRWFCSEILPLLRQDIGHEIRLKVIGVTGAPSLKALDGSDIDLAGRVDDLHAAMAGARLMVVPTRFAAGVPLKVHQSAALGIPMVVSALIGEQIGWKHEQEVLIAGDAEDFAACCARLYRDRELWERVRRNALARCCAECSPEHFRASVREIVDAIPPRHRTPDAAGNAPADAEIRPFPAFGPSYAGRAAEADYSMAVPFAYCPQTAAPPGPVAVIVHLYYPEIAPEIRFYLEQIPFAADIYISTDAAEKRAALEAPFATWSKGRVELRVAPNRGRDIAPKLFAFPEVYAHYEYCLHLHSKKSLHAPFLTPWRGFLFENLIGSPEIVTSIFEAFSRLPDLGIVFPQHFEPVRRWLDWLGNFDHSRDLAARMGITLAADNALDFPSGSMFWSRTAALRPLLDLGLSFDDFSEEGGQTDHTLAHAIERLYLYICERAGFTWLKIANPALYLDARTIVPIGNPGALGQFVADHGVLLSGPNPPSRRSAPAPMITRVPPGLAHVLKSREAQAA